MTLLGERRSLGCLSATAAAGFGALHGGQLRCFLALAAAAPQVVVGSAAVRATFQKMLYLRHNKLLCVVIPQLPIHSRTGG